MPPVRLVRAITVLGLVAACGGAQRRRVAGGPPVRSVSIVAAAGTSLTADLGTLRDGLALELARRRGEPFERYQLVADRDRLHGWYVRHGWFNAEVVSDSARDAGAIDVRFEITEGPRGTLRRVDVQGLPADVDAAAVRALVPLADGAQFDYEVYDLAKPSLTAALERAGYPHARVEAAVLADQTRHDVIIQLRYTPGPRSVFGEVRLSGIDGELAAAARARLHLTPGTRYSSTQLADARAALYDMGRFTVVRVEPDLAGEASVVPVAITVVPSTRHELRLGGGVGMDPATYEVRARASYAVAGFPTPLTTSRVEVQPALVVPRDVSEVQPRVDVRAGVERLDLWRPRVRGDVEAAFEYRTFEAFTTVGPRLRLAVRSPIVVGKLTAGLGWQIEATGFRDVDPALDAALQAELDLAGYQRVGFFEQSAVLDLRDVPSAPRRGIYADLRLQEGGAFAGGAKAYVRVVPELRSYLPLGRTVLALRARLGAILGDVPTSQRFYGGGANGQRGFPERQLSPFATGSDETGSPYDVVYGGAAQIDVGAEVRTSLGRWLGLDLGGVAFLDGGDVTATTAALDLGNLHWATGLGLRIATIIGPVRLDVGYRLNRTGVGEPNGDESFAFHVSIGEAY